MPHRTRPDILISASAGAVSLFGALVLAGWYFHWMRIVQMDPHGAPMVPNTALGFILSGAAVVLFDWGRRRFSILLSVLAMILGAVTLSQYILKLNCGIDEMLLRCYVTTHLSYPGRMAPYTAACFILFNLAFILVTRSSFLCAKIASLLTSCVFAWAAAAVVAYILRIEAIYGLLLYTRMALQTALTFCLLSIALVRWLWLRNETVLRITGLVTSGLITSFLIFGILFSAVEKISQGRWERFAEVRLILLRHELERDFSAVYSLKSLFDSSNLVEPPEFGSFTSLLLETHPAFTALEWAPVVGTEQKESFVKTAREEIAPDYQIKAFAGKPLPADSKQDSFPVYLVTVPAGKASPLGFDLASESRRLEAIHYARESGKLSITTMVRLYGNPEESGIVAFFPVYEKGAAPGRDSPLSGVVSGVFTFNETFNAAFRSLDLDEFSLQVYDVTDGGEELIFSRGTPRRSPYVQELRLSVAQRTWKFIVRPGTAYSEPALEKKMPWLFLAAGLLLTAIISSFFYRAYFLNTQLARTNRDLEKEIESRSRAEAELKLLNDTLHERVHERTTELEKERRGAVWAMIEAERARDAVEKASRALAASEEHFRTLSSSAPIGIFKMNGEGLCEYTNQYWHEISGLDADKSKGQGWAQAVFPEEREKVLALWKTCQADKTEFLTECRLKGPGGAYHWVRLRATSIAGSGSEKGYVLILQDLTDIKLKEERLREKEQLTRSIIETAYDSFVSIDGQGKIIDWNRKAEEEFGWKREEVLGKPIAEVIIPPGNRQDFERALRNYAAGREDPMLSSRMEVSALHKSGKEFMVELSSWPLSTGEGLRFNAFIHDITERKKAEEALNKAVELKLEFASMVSHELRTPLTVIQESVDLLYDGIPGPVNSEQKRFLEFAKINIDRLGRLVNSVLTYQKLDAQLMEFDMRDQDLNGLINETRKSFEIVARNKGLVLAEDLEEGLPPIAFDRDRIAQVLANFLSNAIKFTEKGVVRLRSKREGSFIRVSVEDEGIGIREEDLYKLFQSFSQIRSEAVRNVGGSGLGLAISKKIVEKHQGTIGVESVYGKGSSFFFTLPLKTQPAS